MKKVVNLLGINILLVFGASILLTGCAVQFDHYDPISDELPPLASSDDSTVEVVEPILEEVEPPEPPMLIEPNEPVLPNNSETEDEPNGADEPETMDTDVGIWYELRLPPLEPTDSWQEAYAAILRYYAEIVGCDFAASSNCFYACGWHFILHDINGNGIAELFVKQINCYIRTSYFSAYTFSYNRAIQLELNLTWPSAEIILTPYDNSPWIIAFFPVAGGGYYQRIFLEDNRLTTYAMGFFILGNEGFVLLDEGGEIDSYEWHSLYINFYPYLNDPFNTPATKDEFERTFGGWGEKTRLTPSKINEVNIERIIFWK